MSVIWPEPPCCMGEELCVCGDAERALRGWMSGGVAEPMSPEQRRYCLQEIGTVEGYDRDVHAQEDDATLARTTLLAWADHCRDKGLL